MGNKCTICNGHEQRRAIDKALVLGVPLRTIAYQFNTSHPTLIRHKPHIAKKIQNAQKKQDTQVVKVAKSTIEVGIVDVNYLIATAQNAMMANLAIIQRASNENAANIKIATAKKISIEDGIVIDRQILYANEKMIAVSTVSLLKCVEALKSFMPEPPKHINLNVETGILGMDLKNMSTEELLAIRDA